jgi:hypothetical protein
MDTNESTIPTPESPLSDIKSDIYNPQTTPQVPQTDAKAKENLFAKLKSTSQAAKTASANKVTPPKGNKIEEFLKASEQTDIKRKRGRPKKYATLDEYISAQNEGAKTDAITEPPKEEVKSCFEAGSTDMITPMVNLIAVPILSKKLKRDKKQVAYTKEQQVELSKVLPNGDYMKPSYINYAILAVSLLVINVMQAEKIEIDPHEAQQVKNNITHSREAWIKTGTDENGADIMQPNHI